MPDVVGLDVRVAAGGLEPPDCGGNRVARDEAQHPHVPEALEAGLQAKALGKLGRVVGGFENEPPNVNIFKRRFPSALMIFLNSGSMGQKDPATDRPIEVDPSIPWVADFTLP